ncbi:MAG: hypothetical protein JWQ81_7473 [Amycolatopsis sp.]|nr:hypothetical protein [Amycolatopsis sp.]
MDIPVSSLRATARAECARSCRQMWGQPIGGTSVSRAGAHGGLDGLVEDAMFTRWTGHSSKPTVRPASRTSTWGWLPNRDLPRLTMPPGLSRVDGNELTFHQIIDAAAAVGSAIDRRSSLMRWRIYG